MKAVDVKVMTFKETNATKPHALDGSFALVTKIPSADHA
jgi:hypothetical protein